MKQELVRTKSKISSLKREMSSIQQLHLAQQQVHAQLSAPTIISPRQESYQQNHYYLQDPITNDIKNLSITNNDESILPPSPFNITNPSSSTQTPPLNKFLKSNDHQTRYSTSVTPSSIHIDSSTSPSDEQLRLYLTETLQREKDSAV
jgi:hypothetical protein